MKEPTKIFFDTAPIIYYVEDNQLFASKIEELLEKFEKQKLMINTIVYTELCIKPKRENNKQLVLLFDDFLNNLSFEILNIDKKCAIIATDLMAKYQQIKTIDAIHIASAIAHNCDTFVTNDKQLKTNKRNKYSGIIRNRKLISKLHLFLFFYQKKYKINKFN